MLKKVFFAAALTGLLAGAALPLQSSTAEASSGCWKAAKVKFPGALKARFAYHKECKAHWKTAKMAHKADKKAA
jgi:hypothetical protein